MWRRPVKPWALVVWGVGSLIWIGVCAYFSWTGGASKDDMFVYWACAVVWVLAFLIQSYRYRKQQSA